MNITVYTTARRRQITLVFFIALLITSITEGANSTPLDQLLSLVPKAAVEHSLETAEQIKKRVPSVESWLVEENRIYGEKSNKELLDSVNRVLKADARLHQTLDHLYGHRENFHRSVTADERKPAVCGFLRCMTALTDLSGRLRYYTVDFFTDVIYELEDSPADFDTLINTFIAYKNSAGAIVSVEALADNLSDASTPNFSDHLKGKIIQLARVTRDRSLLPLLMEIVDQNQIDPEFSIFVIDTIRQIGIPQLARPDGDPALGPPVIDSKKILTILSKINPTSLTSTDKQRLQKITEEFKEHNARGVSDQNLQFGRASVRAGDWLLMKNPSPYNRFTDLYPGLFTHVGVVTTELGTDGRNRFVVVDLPEIGNSIPATPVDKFVERTLNFVILRHSDTEVQKVMGDVARAIIGNNSKFDLNFRTTAIERLKGKKLKGSLIDGYCAGLLLLCAQETGKPERNFFPLDERPAGGNTLQNLAKLNVSMPERFLSPTGPLFSSELNLIYRHETMYSPRREIEQAIYDHFAQQMRREHLNPSLNWFHSLRLNLAKAVEKNPALGKALANVAGVNQNIDLIAAAKLGAVVETLDEIAKDASGKYQRVRRAFRIDALDNIQPGVEGDKIYDQIVMRRRIHADLFVRWEAGVITPRELRMELVDYYIHEGCRELDERFFSDFEKTVNNDPDE